MDIILVSAASGKMRRFSLRPRVWVPPILILLAVTALAFASGRYLAAPAAVDSQVAPARWIGRWKQEIDQQRQQLGHLRATAEANANALSRKLAELQAQVIRLDAAGRRMVRIAGVKSDEFDFGKPAAVGGPDLPVSAQPELMGGVMDALDAMQVRLGDRERQLHALEEILLTSKLQKEVIPSGWPIKDGYISSGYGTRIDPFTGRRSFHPGIDFAGPEGEKVHAVAAGIVTRAGPDAGYGNLVEINDGNGYVTMYGHNEKILVKVGQRVSKGQAIALEGSTGRSTGPHCHLELHIDGKVVDPARFVQASR